MIQPASPHRCQPAAPLRVQRAKHQGYFEAYHERNRTLAEARATVAQRAGFLVLLEESNDGGFIVLTKSTALAGLAHAA